MPVRPPMDSIRPVNKGPDSMKRNDIARLPEQNLRAMPFENNIITKGRDGMMIY